MNSRVHSALVLAFVLGAIPLRADLLLEIAPSGTNALLTWSNSAASLEHSLTVTGAWTTVEGAASPYAVPVTNDASFFRLRLTTGGPFDFRYLAPTFTTGLGDPAGCGCTSPENPNSLSTGGSAQDNGQGSVFLHTGELTQHAVDLAIPGRGMDWQFERRYRSGMSYDGPLGQGWEFNYNRRLAVQANGDVLCVNGLGRADRYVLAGGTYQSPRGFYTRLTRNPDGTFDERDRHGTVHSYLATNMLGIAQLARVRDRNSNQMTFGYNALSQLTNVVDTLGRSISYSYDANGRLTQVMDFAGRTLQFGYDANGDLVSVTSPAVIGTPNGNDFPLGKITRYTYSSGSGDSRLNHNLLTVTAPNEVAVSGPPRLVAQYDTNPASTNADRVLSLTLGGTNASGIGAGGTLNFSYVPLGSAPSNDLSTAVSQTTVTNRNGNVTKCLFNATLSVVQLVRFTKGLRPGEPPGYTNIFAYNRDGEMTTRTNAEMDTVEYTFDSANPDRFQQGNLLQARHLPGPRAGDQAQLVTSTTYETNFNFAATVTDARGNTTTHAYDEHGNRTNTMHCIPGITEAWEYNVFGQVTAHVLPDNGSGSRRRDVFSYYTSAPQTGYLQARVVDSGGLNLTTTYEYDAVGNLTRAVDARTNDTLYSVNALNQVVRERSRAVDTTNGPVRYQRDFFYDANNNLVRSDLENRDDNGLLDLINPTFTTTYAYDILDDRLSVTQEADLAASVVTAYSYDANQNKMLVRHGEATAGRDPFNTVQTLYDERDLVFHVTSAPGSPSQSTTKTDYDGNANPVRTAAGTEDAGGRVTLSTYDGYDRRVTLVDPMGNVTTSHYDPNGNVLSGRVDGELTDVLGNAANVRLSETSYTYDAMDRRVRADTRFFDLQTQLPIGDGFSTTQWTYADNSQVTSSTDDNNHATTNRYDSANRLAHATDPRGNTVSYTYDANGNPATITETDKSDLGSADQTFITRYTYDSLDRLIQTVDNASNTNRYAYDSLNHRAARTDPRGNLTRYAYDGLSRLVRTTRFLTATGDGTGTIIGTVNLTQTWDDSSRQTGMTDDHTNTTRYAYDSLNRRVRTEHADQTTNSFGYDAHDNQIRSVDPNGTVVTSQYDLLNRLATNNIARGAGVLGNTNEVYQYDGLSRLVRAQDDDSLVTRRYDSLSRVTAETQQVLPGGPPRTVSATHDGAGNKTQCVYPGGRVINYTYDALDRRLTVSDPALPPMIASYWYRGPEAVEQRDFGNGTRLAVACDGLRRVTNALHTRIIGGVLIDQHRYGWDGANNKVQFDEPLGFSPDLRAYRYDSLNRLVRSEIPVNGVTNTYAFDGVGNRTTVTGGAGAGVYFMNPTNPPGDFQVNQYTTTPFDSRQYDANGSLTGTFSTPRLFSYDYRNQLVQFVDVQSGTTTTYRHDCRGRRTEKNVAGTITRFYYDGRQEIEEQNAFGNTLGTYVWGNAGEGPLQLSRGVQRGYYHNDNRGSALKFTDANNGQVVEQYRYDDYGAPALFNGAGVPISQSSVGNPYLFAGARYDSESRLFAYQGRWVDPAAGRFITRAAAVAEDTTGLGNLYAFEGNHPGTTTVPIDASNEVYSCCCPTKIEYDPKSKKAYNNVSYKGKPGYYGHYFEVKFEMKWKTTTEKIEMRDRGCRLKWMEYCIGNTATTTSGKEVPKNEWYDVADVEPGSGTLGAWASTPSSTPYMTKTKNHDYPLTNDTKNDRTAYFHISLAYSEKCPCENVPAPVTLTQTIAGLGTDKPTNTLEPGIPANIGTPP
jgi:YD repeat-containing protein